MTVKNACHNNTTKSGHTADIWRRGCWVAYHLVTKSKKINNITKKGDTNEMKASEGQQRTTRRMNTEWRACSAGLARESVLIGAN